MRGGRCDEAMHVDDTNGCYSGCVLEARPEGTHLCSGSDHQSFMRNAEQTYISTDYIVCRTVLRSQVLAQTRQTAMDVRTSFVRKATYFRMFWGP